MNVTITHTDPKGVTQVHLTTITLAKFIKHFVLAGSGFTPSATLLSRGFGALAWYWDFVQPVAGGSDCFGEPAPILRDPSLKAHFSNLAGRAFADLLVRKFTNAWITLSYEGVLEQRGLPIVGPRPDLLAVNPRSVVALEAKGYSKKSVSNTEMLIYKNQASQGQLLRHAWAASVAYGLYDRTKVKYADPEDDGPAPSLEMMQQCLVGYFVQVDRAISQFGGTERSIEGRRIKAIPLTEIVRGRVPIDADHSGVLNRLMLLIDRDIVSIVFDRLERLSRSGGQDSEQVEQLLVNDTDTMFIDSDGIGISTTG